MKKENGFTLVELSVVLTIIGLLIGGVLVGKDLLENSLVTATIKQIQSYDAAVFTFQDTYNALPGDIRNPATRLPNCSASPCNISGNGNGVIGPTYTSSAYALLGDETNTMWLHINAAGLTSGINPNSTWTSGSYELASYPVLPLGGIVFPGTYDLDPFGAWTEGLNGTYWLLVSKQIDNFISLRALGKIDRMIDDGHPYRGNFGLSSSGCGMTNSETTYPSSDTKCQARWRASF